MKLSDRLRLEADDALAQGARNLARRLSEMADEAVSLEECCASGSSATRGAGRNTARRNGRRGAMSENVTLSESVRAFVGHNGSATHHVHSDMLNLWADRIAALEAERDKLRDDVLAAHDLIAYAINRVMTETQVGNWIGVRSWQETSYYVPMRLRGALGIVQGRRKHDDRGE